MKKIILILLVLVGFTSCTESQDEYIYSVEYKDTFTVDQNNDIVNDSILYKTKLVDNTLYLIDEDNNTTLVKVDDSDEVLTFLFIFIWYIVMLFVFKD